MDEKKKKIILDLTLKSITIDEFKVLYPENIDDDGQYTLSLLEAVSHDKDKEGVECALLLLFQFGYSKKFTPILIKLLYSDWHYMHENIALILNDLKDETSIECLYDTVNSKFEYLDYDDSYALAVKCIWALGNIGTIEAQKKLKLLLNSHNPIIQKNAKEQLDRLN